MAEYVDAARALDWKISTVVAALEEAGVLEDTLIINTTDHGIAFPGMKCNLTDHGIGVLLIMRGPLPGGGGRVVDALVSQVDIYPTLCDMLGIALPDWLQGESLAPLLAGDTESVRDAVFAEVNFHSAYEPKRCVRTDRWKYIRRYDARDHILRSNCDNSITKDYWVAQGWGEQPADDERLFDLVFDPHETCNLASDPRHAEILAQHRQLLDAWMQETTDPLLEGQPVMPPQTAQITDADAAHPRAEGQIHDADAWVRLYRERHG
jgi:arylsulfatase A-like enzyme